MLGEEINGIDEAGGKDLLFLQSRMALTTNNYEAEITKQHLYFKIEKFKNHTDKHFQLFPKHS